MELYKKYRPKKLRSVVGNETTIKSIGNKLKNNTLPHFILLSGPSGCGKTTVARIICKELRCSVNDFYEINCANRNGVELARDIESKFHFRSINGGVRIWLLDECHKMTSACAESLLKPLEDTPKHVYFIFATTEPQKVLKTIRTRATEYKMNSLSENQLNKLLTLIIAKEKINVQQHIIDEIVENSDGSVRLALVLLDKIKDLDEKEMKEAIQQSKNEEAEAYELLKVLMKWDRRGWQSCQKILMNLKQDPESVRRYILATCSNQLLKMNKGNNHNQAFEILCSFEKDFFSTGKAGLITSCYDVLKGD